MRWGIDALAKEMFAGLVGAELDKVSLNSTTDS
jgi:hypothetical protein